MHLPVVIVQKILNELYDCGSAAARAWLPQNSG